MLPPAALHTTQSDSI